MNSPEIYINFQHRSSGRFCRAIYIKATHTHHTRPRGHPAQRKLPPPALRVRIYTVLITIFCVGAIQPTKGAIYVYTILKSCSTCTYTVLLTILSCGAIQPSKRGHPAQSRKQHSEPSFFATIRSLCGRSFPAKAHVRSPGRCPPCQCPQKLGTFSTTPICHPNQIWPGHEKKSLLSLGPRKAAQAAL